MAVLLSDELSQQEDLFEGVGEVSLEADQVDAGGKGTAPVILAVPDQPVKPKV